MGSSSVCLQSPLGAATAVLLVMGTIFLGRAAKGRRVARRALDHKDTSLEEREASIPDHEETNRGNSGLQETEPSSPGANVVPDIFLSHSGRQKPFVECLYDALQRANHTVFFDQHTLPKGSPFPSQITQAATGCKIGVVVLSEEFLTSKWPMKELEMLVLQRGPKPCVLPLFYGLNPADLNSPKKLLKWRRVWKEMGCEDGAKQWEQVVIALKHFNGEVYKQGTSTSAYINKVVQRICALIPCPVPYDCSSTQGQLRLVQEIATKFVHFDASQACMVGLYGVGGLGKTTLCKAMVNYYSSHYYGRSFLIEFPSTGGDKSTIALECKKALNKLTDASNEHLLNKADSFDQVVQLMKDRVGCHDVFLAIDNVWESSLEEAKRVLRVGFSAKSKILVTSRSKEVLEDLLMVRGPVNNASVARLPTPEREEAFQIFQETFESYDLSALVDSNQMDKVLGRCRFSGSYHALALKALAKYVKRVCMTADPEGIKHDLSCVFEEISYEDLSVVEDVIRLSYDNLPEQRKHMFLDIVVYIKEWRIFKKENFKQDYKENIHLLGFHETISLLHWKFPKSKTTRLINELFLDGLIQIEVGKHGTKFIELHDLYLEFAWREIGSSPRYLISNITQSVEKIEWEKLEMVMLDGDGLGPCLFEKLQQCKKCSNLKFLRASGVEIKSGVRLNSMPSLTFLILGDDECVRKEKREKENVAQSHLLQPLEKVPGMRSLDQEGTIKNSRASFVTEEGLVDASHILHLNGFVELRAGIIGCGLIEGIAGLDALGNLRSVQVGPCERLKSLDGLSSLIKLWKLRVKDCRSLRKLPDVSSLTCLEELWLEENEVMEEVGGLSCTLKLVHVSRCRVLKRMPDVSSLTCLEKLRLYSNEAMEEVEGEYLSSTLKQLDITDCRRLRSCPSLDECMHMKRLRTGCAHHISSLQKLPNLHTCLQQLTINHQNCGWSTIKKIVGCLTNLKLLAVNDCGALEEMGDLSALRSLKNLTILSCPSLKKLNVGCASLKSLMVCHCKALEEIIGDFKALPILEDLIIDDCQSLEKLEGISSTPLQYLCLKRCGSLQESSIPEAILPRPGEGHSCIDL